MAELSLVGREYWTATVTVEAGALARFSEALHGPSSGPPSPEASGAFLQALVPFDAFVALVGHARQIHASEFQLEHLRPVVPGMRLEVRSKVSDIVRHHGAVGPTDVVSVDDEARDAATGEPVYRARRVYAVIGAKEAA